MEGGRVNFYKEKANSNSTLLGVNNLKSSNNFNCFPLGFLSYFLSAAPLYEDFLI